MKNFLLKFFVRIARPLIPLHPKKGRILVVATTALGDTLWATPALASIRRTFPNAYLAVLTSPIGLEILQHNPSIDQLHLSTPFIWRALYREQFDTILVFHASQRLVYPLCALLGASRMIGTAGINKGLDCLFTQTLPNLYQHEIARRLQIAEQIGVIPSSERLSFFLQPSEKPEPLPKGPWIAIHPGSKDSFKRWPAELFAQVGRMLKQQIPCEILVTGNASELALMREVAEQIPGAHLCDTKLSLRAFAAKLNQIDLLISNDTGPVHLACALNRPVIAIYSSTDPALCGPYKAEKAIAIYRRKTCTPCLKRQCNRPFCLLQIAPAEVVEKALHLLS